FRCACDYEDPDLARSLTPLGEFLGGRAPPAQKERLLCHPLFLEGLHGLAPCCPKLRHWHDSVTAPPNPLPEATDDPAPPASLGHVALACRLRGEGHDEGEYRLCTDVLGRIEFPFCDWNLTLYTDQRDCLGRREWLGRQLVKLRLDHGLACWQLDNSTELPFLVLSCEDCRRLILANADPREFRGLEFPNARLKPRLQCACPLGHGPIRYDPI